MNPNGDPILDAFATLHARQPGATLIASVARRSTAAEIEALSQSLGDLVDEADLPPGTIVGLAAPNGPGFLAALLALRRAGHPVLLIDALTPAPERHRIVGELRAAAVLSSDLAWPAGPADFLLARGDSEIGSPASGASAAIIKLTSGSTGEARGIAVSSRALVADDRALAVSMGLRRDDVFVAAVPFSHSYGFSSLVLPALLRGSLLALPHGNSPFSPLDAAARLGGTVFPSVPGYLAGLTRAGEIGALPASLRLIVSAGGPLPAPAAKRFRARFGRPIQVFYGASECGGITFDRAGTAAERGTVGEPVDGVVVTLEHDPAGGGSEGRVVVESAAVAGEYLPVGDERLAGGRFRSDDLAAWNGSELELRGKLSQMVNVGGRKVNPREVERVILELDGVDDVVVTSGGDGTRGWVEAVVASGAGSLSVRDVLRWCRSQLAPFKTPRRVVVVPALPRDQRGKLEAAALAVLRTRAPGGEIADAPAEP